jgi:hypothetical protein
VTMGIMLSYAGMSCINYSATLNGWAANPATPSGRTLTANGRSYGTSAVAARTYLDVDKGWTITADVASSSTCAVVLPVEWLSFTGEQQENSIVLNWQTARERGNLGYGVERSADGASWQPIGFVPAQNTDNVQSYIFRDEKVLDECPAGCKWYYRLRQTDLDGGEELSKIISVKTAGAAGSSGIRVFPNPVSNGLLSLVLPETLSGEMDIRLLNSTGQAVRSAALGAGVQVWDIGDLAPGIYTISAWNAGAPFFEKIVVQY